MTKDAAAHKIFLIGVLLKFINGVLEIIGGAVFLLGSEAIKIINTLVYRELVVDPADIAANAIRKFLPYLSTRFELFAAFYLLSHGVIKIILVVALIRKKLWAYPVSIIIFTFFIIYQFYRYALTHSFLLVLLSLIDILVIYFILREYRRLKTI